MPISKEDDKSLWEEYDIILLSHIVMYWIWFLLDSDECLLVTWVSPPIFGLQHCCRFRKRMQLNMGGLRLNSLFLYNLFHHLFLYLLFFFFNCPSFCSLYFFFFYSFYFYFLLQPMLILTGLSWCHKFQLHFMSLIPQIKGTFIKIERFKMNHAHLKRRWQEFVGATSHNTSFTYCPVQNLILAWFGWKVVGNLSFSTNLWLTTLLSLSQTNATKHGWPSIKHLAFLLPFPSSFSLLPFLFLQFLFLLQFIFCLFLFFLFLFSPSTCVDPSWLVLVS